MQHHPRVLIDVDGVLADFSSGVFDIIWERTGTRPHVEDFPDWEITAQIPDEEVRKHVSERIRAPGFCLALRPYPEALSGFRRVAEVADVYIVTTPLSGSKTWMYERDRWLQLNFGIPKSKIVHAGTKCIVRGDFFVDDKPDNVRLWKAGHRDSFLGVGLLWDTPHTQAEKELTRVYSWDELAERILRGGPSADELEMRRLQELGEQALLGEK